MGGSARPSNLGSTVLVLLGPPAAGKSTLASTILAEHHELGRFVVRHQLAIERRRRSDLWEAARASQEAGTWLPDAVVIELLARCCRSRSSPGLVVEGLPANPTQATMLRELVELSGRAARCVLYLDAPDEVCLARMRQRTTCSTCDGTQPIQPVPGGVGLCAVCGSSLARRADDSEAAFAERLRLHRQRIPGILAAFDEGEVVVLDATRRPCDVADSARSSLARLV